MTPDQFVKLLEVIEKVSTKTFSISDATDWPLIVFGGGVILTLVGVMWRDLRMAVISSIRRLSDDLRDFKQEIRTEIDKLRKDNDKEHDALRAEINAVRDKVFDHKRCTDDRSDKNS
jgi:hypothetical protein